MNKGDKVRIKDWDDSVWEGFEAEVIEVDEYNGPYLKPLSDRPDGFKRHEFYWPESKLELISEEKTFKVGDRVRVTSSPDWGEVEIGDVVTITHVYLDTSFHAETSEGVEVPLDPSKVELVTEERQTIEVGDTVKATHAESGSVVQGVVSYADNEYQDNFEVNVNENGFATLDLYTYQGWEFELVAKKEVPEPAPKVGDPWSEGLPVGTVMDAVTWPGCPEFRVKNGWVSPDGSLDKDDTDWNPDVWKIVYLPPSASE